MSVKTEVTLGPGDSHFNDVVCSIGKLQSTDIYTDVLIHCKDNKTVRASKLLLSLSSAFMNQIFVNHTAGYNTDVYNILLPDFDAEAMQMAVNLVQTGKNLYLSFLCRPI